MPDPERWKREVRRASSQRGQRRGPETIRCPYCSNVIKVAEWASHQGSCYLKWFCDNAGKKTTTNPPRSN